MNNRCFTSFLCFLFFTIPRVARIHAFVPSLVGRMRSTKLMATFVDQVEGPFRANLLQSHWGRRPLLIRNAFQSSEISWPTWDDIVYLAGKDETSRLIRHIPGNLPSFDLEFGPFDGHDVQDLKADLEYKWTILLNDVDRQLPKLSTWMDHQFDFLPRWRRDDAQVSIATTLGGIGPHVDNYDVFLIQTSGTRTWSINIEKISEKEEIATLIPELPVRILHGDFEYETLELCPGDALYLPPRVVHCGKSTSENCMTLSVGCRAPSVAELVARVAEEVQDSVGGHYVDSFSDLLEQTRSGNPSISMKSKSDMKNLVRTAFQQILDDDSRWDTHIGKLVTESTRYRGDIVDFDADDVLCQDSPEAALESILEGKFSLKRSDGVAFATSAVKSNGAHVWFRLFADGQEWEIRNDPSAQTIFEGIERGNIMDTDSLKNTSVPVRSVIIDLIDRGLLTLI